MQKLLPIISTVLLILTLSAEGFVAWKFYDQADQTAQIAETTDNQTEAAKPVDSGAPVMMDIGETTVNLAPEDNDNETRFLRVQIALQLRDEDARDQITAKITKITDLTLNILSSKTFSEIRSAQGKYDLKVEMVDRLNRLTGGDPIKDIFFVDFVSQ